MIDSRVVVIVCIAISSVAATALSADFDASVGSLLLTRCVSCHHAGDPSGELDLTRHETLLRGGASGQAITPGNADESLLFQHIASGEMPKEGGGHKDPLLKEEIELFRTWIDTGAHWPEGRVLDLFERTTPRRAGRDWWSLKAVHASPIPSLSGAATANPIDAFISLHLRERGLVPAPKADPRTLLRRLSFDLIGLPPSPLELDEFLADASPNAWENVVDRLLASPHYGERWARHWLDIARFAETNGYERDAEKPGAWKYRDWVVNAFNSDMPFDRFVREQIAGDEVPDRNESTVIATGFLRIGTWDDEPNDPKEYQYERLEDMVHATSTAFLGLSIKCARCHDHKFDPILHSDYYRFASAFWAGPIGPRASQWLGGPTKEELGFDVLGWTDLSAIPSPLHVLAKGDVSRPLGAVQAGAPMCVAYLQKDFDAPPQGFSTSRRRLQLAEWITDPKHPLTSRVIVNRLWQHHFGEGLVRTPDNFGFLGRKPTHPDLLDWLAHRLVSQGWHLKQLHKLMVMSETYQQSSLHPDALACASVDAENNFVWRANRRRLDAESIRDAMLVTSGQLDLHLGGPSFLAPISDEALEGLSMKSGAYQASPLEASRRRSLYMFTKRGLIVPLMTTFDMCDTTTPTGRRDVSTVALQALVLLNNPWVHQQSRSFAMRILAESKDNSSRIDAAWRLALGYVPDDSQHKAAQEHLAVQRSRIMDRSPDTAEAEILSWTSLCQVLFNTNEFLYVD